MANQSALQSTYEYHLLKKVVRAMSIGQTVKFESGAVLVRNKRSYQVTDINGKVYSSLNKNMAAMIAIKGE